MEKQDPKEYTKLLKELEEVEVGIFHAGIEKHVGRLFLTAVQAMKKGVTKKDTEKKDKQEKINLSKTGLYSIFLKRLKKP